MGIKYGRGWGGARILLSRGSILSREYFPSSCVCAATRDNINVDTFLRYDTRCYFHVRRLIYRTERVETQ